MKENILIKVISVLLIAVLAISSLSPVYAEGEGKATTATASDWKSTTQFDGKNDSTIDGTAQKIIGAILGVTRIIAVGIAIIMLIVVAMKYMMSAPGDRADIKKHAVVYVVGAVVLFGASGILSIIEKFASTNLSATK